LHGCCYSAPMRPLLRHLFVVAIALTTGAIVSVDGQTQGQAQAGQGRGGGRGGGQQVEIDEARARQLYVSNRHEDHPRANYQGHIDARVAEETRYAEACKGLMECTKV